MANHNGNSILDLILAKNGNESYLNGTNDRTSLLSIYLLIIAQ